LFNSNIAKGMYITWCEMGVVVDKFEDTDDGIIMLFTVPRSAPHLDASGKEMSGKHLASRIKETCEEMGLVFKDIRYAIRDEYWSEDKCKAARVRAKQDLGYKKWQIKEDY